MLIYWYNFTTTHLECVRQGNYTDNEFCLAWFSSGGVDAKGLATDLVNFPNTSKCGGDSYNFAMAGVSHII
jgi:hypothetical protein